uniref:Putative Permease of the major facilitator superfamily n=1 Tax=mine drainage metagenome TaxID=410659 RepID=E6QPS3_9ZZZZ
MVEHLALGLDLTYGSIMVGLVFVYWGAVSRRRAL